MATESSTPYNLELTTVSNRRSDFGTSPFFEHQSTTKTILHVDSYRYEVCRLDPDTKETESVHMGEEDGIINFAVPYKFDRNYILVGRVKKLQRLKWDTRDILDMATIEEDDPKRSLCRGAKCDRRGRLYFGTALIGKEGRKTKKEGYLYRVDARMKVTKCEGVYMYGPAGMAWNPDNTLFYCADAWHQMIEVFDYNEKDGSVSNQRALVPEDTFRHGLIPWDIMCTTDGWLWAIVYRDVSDVDTRIQLIDIKSSPPIIPRGIRSYLKMSAFCFGIGPSKAYDEMYVTCSRRSPNESEVSTNEEANAEDDGVVIKVSNLGSVGFPFNAFGS